jgi:hypothetical protein
MPLTRKEYGAPTGKPSPQRCDQQAPQRDIALNPRAEYRALPRTCSKRRSARRARVRAVEAITPLRIGEQADADAIENILAMKNITPQTHASEEFRRIRDHQANGMGGLPLVGDPDMVAGDWRGWRRPASPGSRCHLSTISTSCPISAPRCCRAWRGRGCARSGARSENSTGSQRRAPELDFTTHKCYYRNIMHAAA